MLLSAFDAASKEPVLLHGGLYAVLLDLPIGMIISVVLTTLRVRGALPNVLLMSHRRHQPTALVRQVPLISMPTVCFSVAMTNCIGGCCLVPFAFASAVEVRADGDAPNHDHAAARRKWQRCWRRQPGLRCECPGAFIAQGGFCCDDCAFISCVNNKWIGSHKMLGLNVQAQIKI